MWRSDFCVVLGFLFHRPTGKVLLQQKGHDAPWFPGMWELFGGRMDEEDRGDPLVTWRRELREEIGIELAPELMQAVDDYVNEYGFRRMVFFTEWPELQVDFDLTEGVGFAWFPVGEAMRLPDISPLARRDVTTFARKMGLGA